MRVRHQDATTMIYDAPVDFFRHAIVVAAVAGFHVVHGDAHSRGDHRRQRTIRIPQQEQPIRLDLRQRLTCPRHDLPNLIGKDGRLNAQMKIRRSQTQFLKENIAQVFVIVLTSVHQDLIAEKIEVLDHATEADNFRAGAEESDNFHRNTSSSVSMTSSIIRRCDLSRATVSLKVITLSLELYSFFKQPMLVR